MRAATKGEMRGVHPLDVETMRVGVLRRVMARCEQRTDHRLTRVHLPAADLPGLQRKSTSLHYRRVVSQHLLNRIGHKLGVRGELNIRARSSRPLSLRRCIDQLRIVRRIAVSAFVLAAGLNETPMPPSLLLTILGLNV